MTPEALKTLKDQLIGAEPAIAILQQTGGHTAHAITTLHSVLVQVLHGTTPDAPKPNLNAALATATAPAAPADAPAASSEVAITPGTPVPAPVNT